MFHYLVQNLSQLIRDVNLKITIYFLCYALLNSEPFFTHPVLLNDVLKSCVATEFLMFHCLVQNLSQLIRDVNLKNKDLLFM